MGKASLEGSLFNKNLYKKKEISPINNITLHLTELGKEQIKPLVSRRKEIKKIIAEIVIRHKIEKINETKNWFLKR